MIPDTNQQRSCTLLYGLIYQQIKKEWENGQLPKYDSENCGYESMVRF